MRQNKTGVLLVNLGTPASTQTSAVKDFLRQFLSDPRVVDQPRWLWWPLLRMVILPLRAPRVARLYRAIWMSEGSPLLVWSRRQCAALAERLPMPVALGMSYGKPDLAYAVQQLMQQGITHLIVLPLYPQFSSSTVGAVWDGLQQAFQKARTLPTITFIRDYAEHPDYISALVHSIKRAFAAHGEPQLLVISWHGIPQRYAEEGDDYPARCAATTQAVVQALKLDPARFIMTFQSRFGREPWLQPYTDETLRALPAKGIHHIQVISPGFASDCLETLEELNQQNRALFMQAGGKQFDYIPALNADELHITMMENIVLAHCGDVLRG